MAIRNLSTYFRKRQLAEPAAGKQLLVRDVGERKRRFRKVVQFIVRFKTHFREHEAKQIAEKHINRELAAVKLEWITILPNLVAVEDCPEHFGFERVQVSVGDNRAREVFRVRSELLRELHRPLVRARLTHLAQPQA